MNDPKTTKRGAPKMNGTKSFLVFALSIVAFAAMVYGATGPVSPQSVSLQNTSTFDPTVYSAKSVEALAGNLTKFNVDTVSVTQNWAGFYGNITGTIVLDDADNYSLFSWSEPEPTGIIFAVNETISNWETAHCFNYTNIGASGTEDNYSKIISYDGDTLTTNSTEFITLETLERVYNISPDQADGVDETFNTSNSHDGFFVGDTEILINDCNSANMYQNDQAQDDNGADNFQEVLLAVNDSDAVVFTQIIENRDVFNETDRQGFDGQEYDFQMLVLENGKFGDEAVTPYYIYIELT